MTPRRGEVWLVSLGAARAGEPGKNRPAVILSVDELHSDNPEELVVVVPLSSSMAHSALRPEMGTVPGLDHPSRAICRAVRGLARRRLLRRIAEFPPAALEQVEQAMTLILGLDQTAR